MAAFHCVLTLVPFFFCVLFLFNLQRANVTKLQGTPISIERRFNTISYMTKSFSKKKKKTECVYTFGHTENETVSFL